MALLAAVAAERSTLSIHMACLAAVVDAMSKSQQQGTAKTVLTLLIITSPSSRTSTTHSVTCTSGTLFSSACCRS
jgi:hypothetical protein